MQKKKKTKEIVIHFSKKENSIPPSNIHDVKVERVTSYTYLGVEIDNKLTFKECAQSKFKKLQKRMFFLMKLASFRIDSCMLQLFYKALLQRLLVFGLICAYGNMLKKDQKKLQHTVKAASGIIRIDQVSVAQRFNDLCISKTQQTLNDPTHPLHQFFLESNRSNRPNRLLQRKIRTSRYNKSFICAYCN